jgi:hypothetical protein
MGPIAAALTGGVVGAAGGGLLGALIGAGIPEEQAQRYERGIREGNIVMGVTPRNEEDAAYFEREWRNYRGEDIYRPTRRGVDGPGGEASGTASQVGCSLGAVPEASCRVARVSRLERAPPAAPRRRHALAARARA